MTLGPRGLALPSAVWPYRSKFPDCLAGAVPYSYRNVDLLRDNVIAGLGMAPLPVLAKSRPVAIPLGGPGTLTICQAGEFSVEKCDPALARISWP
jgi:hypothetical protein